jgi:hypothetical protein
MILMLGFPGSGKTLLLAALYHYFALSGGHGITLIPDDKSERELSEMTGEIQDTSNPYLPGSTTLAETREWCFDVRVDWANGRERAFELAYLDYAGEHVQKLAIVDQEEDPDEKFMVALREASIVMGVLDGSKVLKLMTEGYSAPLVAEIGVLLRRLVLAEQKSVHIIVSKWDILVDPKTRRRYSATQIIGALEGCSEGFRNFRRNPRLKSMRVIPVASLGDGFAEPDPADPEGLRMIKKPGAQWRPRDAAIPFFCAIPDVIKGDAALLASHSDEDDGRRAAGASLGRNLSWVTFAAAAIAGITIVVVSHGVTATIPFIQLADRIRQSLEERTAKKDSRLHPADEALAHVLRVCYQNMDRYDQ